MRLVRKLLWSRRHSSLWTWESCSSFTLTTVATILSGHYEIDRNSPKKKKKERERERQREQLGRDEALLLNPSIIALRYYGEMLQLLRWGIKSGKPRIPLNGTPLAPAAFVPAKAFGAVSSKILVHTCGWAHDYQGSLTNCNDRATISNLLPEMTQSIKAAGSAPINAGLWYNRTAMTGMRFGGCCSGADSGLSQGSGVLPTIQTHDGEYQNEHNHRIGIINHEI